MSEIELPQTTYTVTVLSETFPDYRFVAITCHDNHGEISLLLTSHKTQRLTNTEAMEHKEKVRKCLKTIGGNPPLEIRVAFLPLKGV